MSTHETTRILARVPVFQGLSARQIRGLAQTATQRAYAAGEQIILRERWTNPQPAIAPPPAEVEEARVTPTDAQEPNAQAPGGPAGLSVESSTIRQLLDTPAARAILDKYFPGMTEDSRLAMAAGMTLQQIAPFAPQVLTGEKLQAVDEELQQIQKG